MEEDHCLRNNTSQRNHFGSFPGTTVTIRGLKAYSIYAIYVKARSSGGPGVETSAAGYTSSEGNY